METLTQLPRERDGRGRFVRQESRFREMVLEPPPSGRFHLYVSLACPWASRAVIVRRLKRLEKTVGMTVLDPLRDARGWRFREEAPDPLNGFTFLVGAYLATDPSFDQRVTVPVLWDIAQGRIVNNESTDIIRMFNAWSDDGPDLYPPDLRPEIDRVNDRVYRNLNNGVYRAGFAGSQEAYEEAFDDVFDTLAWLDRRLAERRYLTGDRLTEADIRLFTTLIRFDPVYFGHFKCNLRRIADYAALAGYLRDLYQHPGIAETVDFDQIKRHYYMTHERLNPSRIVPKGPAMDLWAPHGRERLSRRAA